MSRLHTPPLATALAPGLDPTFGLHIPLPSRGLLHFADDLLEDPNRRMSIRAARMLVLALYDDMCRDFNLSDNELADVQVRVEELYDLLPQDKPDLFAAAISRQRELYLPHVLEDERFGFPGFALTVVQLLDRVGHGFDATPDAILSNVLRNSRYAHLAFDILRRPGQTAPLWDKNWRSEPVVGLARRMYQSNNFVDLPGLADLLEDEGCSDSTVLDHCTSCEPHVRGCWVVDWVLGYD